MQPILDAMRKTISQHYRGKKIIGAIALQEVKDFFQIKKKSDDVVREKEIIEGYIKNGKLFIRTSDLELKIQIFKQKKELITLINKKLETLGYKYSVYEIYTK